jgi:GNAT superfamily N-acetyltransferase
MSWQILHRWFNVSPYKDAKYIQDIYGEKFWLSWFGRNEGITKLRIRYYGMPAGHAHVTEDDAQTLCLADLCLVRRHQRSGLGKVMLQLIIEWARERGYNEIYGHIVPREEVTFEYLREWYKRQGFHVEGNKIHLVL